MKMNKKKVLECVKAIKNWGGDWCLATKQMWTVCSSIIDFMIDYMESEEKDVSNCFEKGIKSALCIHDVTLVEEPVFIAEFTKWNGEIITQEIKEIFIDDIVCAIKGQYYYANTDMNLIINGSEFSKVNIYKIDSV